MDKSRIKIVFVCLGNICRSPLAEALFIQRVNAAGAGDQYEISSCGTANYHIGDPPDARTIKNAAKNGVQINHIGRQFSVNDLTYYDLIIPMDKSNYNNILRFSESGQHQHKIKMMRQFDPVGKGLDVPDPWSGGEKDFQEVFEILKRSTAGLLEFLKLPPSGKTRRL